jgi:molybdate transport system ATP-binding protein
METNSPLVSLEHVDVDIGGARILRDIDWRLVRGEHLGIVGANGSGKSTLLALIAGTAWPAPERGVRRYDFGEGTETDALRARAEIVIVGHELQDRYVRWGWNFTALDVVLSGVYRTDVPRQRPATPQRSLALATMRRLGVGHLAERRFLELSRGEQRRVLIARGVAFEPSVLLLDEPASGLDAEARRELSAMLAIVAGEHTIVCAAHEPTDLPAPIERYLLLRGGRIVGAYTRGPRDDEPAAAPAPAVDEPDGQLAQTPEAALIEVVHADIWRGGRRVLRDVSWRLDAGQQWLVTGANGSGKSSFLRLLHGQLRPALGGEIRWPALGNPRNIWALRKQVAWLSPELQAQYRFPSTVRECIGSGFESSVGLTRTLTGAESARVDELVAELELASLAERRLDTLSYGQARRALIGRALVNRPRVLLFDEPWEGLDSAMAELLDRSLRSVIASGTQLVCASHLRTHRGVFTHALVLEGGEIVRAGTLTL